jgi:hypothetical protein
MIEIIVKKIAPLFLEKINSKINRDINLRCLLDIGYIESNDEI